MKIIIDPYRGGNDTGDKINGQYEKTILLNLSKNIEQKLKEKNILVELVRTNDISLTEDERISIINEIKEPNDIIIQNRISDDNEFDIIYPLRNSDKLASLLTSNIEKAGITVDKYYQRRLPTNTTLDYYSTIRNTKPNETLILEFKQNSDYDKIAGIIAKVLSEYISKENTYVIKKGDTLYQIAKTYNTSVDEIKKLNNLNNNNLKIGQIIKLPNKNLTENQDNIVYIIKKGDTLYQIAKTYNTSVDEIKKLNNLKNNTLNIGQQIKIPQTSEDYTVYAIKKGDTLYQIAKKYNTSVDEIKRINNLKNNTLNIGQQLKIPR